MLFATTIGEHFFNVMLAVIVLLVFAVKILAAVDDDGEVKKTANEGLAAWIGRWFK